MKKFSVHYGALGNATNFADGFNFLRSCRLDGVELIMKEDGVLSPKASKNFLHDLRNIAEDAGICISGLTNACLWSHPLTSEDSRQRRLGIESILHQIDIAVELDVQNLLIIPGYAGTDYIATSEKIPYDIAMQRVRQGLSRVSRTAEQAGVYLCVENVWNRLMLSPLELAALVDEANSSAVKLYFDVGNAMLYGDPELWIPILNNRIKAVHIKDVLRNRADVSAHVPLGEGNVPFEQIRCALEDVHYEGWLTLECHRLYEHSCLRQQIALMRNIFTIEKEKIE